MIFLNQILFILADVLVVYLMQVVVKSIGAPEEIKANNLYVSDVLITWSHVTKASIFTSHVFSDVIFGGCGLSTPLL